MKQRSFSEILSLNLLWEEHRVRRDACLRVCVCDKEEDC